MRANRGPDESGSDEHGAAEEAAAGKRTRTEAVQRKLAADTAPPVLAAAPHAPAADAFDFSFVQRRGGAEAPSDPATVGRIAESGLAAGGSEVPHKDTLEHGFGVDLSGVRAHTGAGAADASRAIGAEAYTMGSDIAFTTASPSPELVAHEVAHVIQQGAGAGPASGVGQAGDRFEQEADAAASVVAGGGQSDLAGNYSAPAAGASLQRRAVQRYESAEHAMLADGMTYPCKLSPMQLENGACPTRGELVAFGDFYGSFEALQRAPREEVEALIGIIRWEGVWTLAARQKQQGTATGDEPLRFGLDTAAETDDSAFHGGHVDHAKGKKKGVVTWDDAVFDTVVAEQKLRDVAMAIHAQFSPTWQFFGMNVPLETFSHGALTIHHMKATLGRRRFRNVNNTLGSPHNADLGGDTENPDKSDPGNLGGDYFDLASNNLSHFAIGNWATWENYHAKTCKKVEDAKKSGDAAALTKATNEAVMEDAWGNHFLSDMFSAGHVVNKQALMTEATGMMIGMAESHGIAKKGDDKHEVVRSMLTEALQLAFYDDAVYEGWKQGCHNAFDQGLVRYDELELMLQIARGTSISGGAPSVVGNLVDTLMGMPWRDLQANNTAGGDRPGSRPDDTESFGPGNKKAGKGDYQLGVGNLAALTVHDALNAIGFTARNGCNSEWRMQGDSHLTAETAGYAKMAIDASKSQVELGQSKPDDVKMFLPKDVRMERGWLEQYLEKRQKEGQQYDGALLAEVRAKAEALSTFVPLSEGNDVSKPLSDLCSAIMRLEFTAPKDQYKALLAAENVAPSASNTGVNIAFLRLFLKENLPRMVPVAYAASSAGDLPAAALEVYKPRKDDGTVLPSAANNFRWNGQTLTFEVNVTDCKPGTQRLGIQVIDHDGTDMDYLPSGQRRDDPAAMIHDTDETIGKSFSTTVTIPEGLQPDRNGRSYVTATWSMKNRGDATHGEHYVRVFSDADCTMVIGRSETQETQKHTSNPKPVERTPKATGADADVRSVYNATGIEGNAFAWDKNSLRFRLKSAAPEKRPEGATVRAWVKQFNEDSGNDYDVEGRQIPTTAMTAVDEDSLIKGPEEISVPVGEASIFQAVDDPNDTYVIVYADPGCTMPLGRSERQGTNRGTVRGGAPAHAATAVSGFQWKGTELSFAVEPANVVRVYAKLFDKDGGYDYDAGGQRAPGVFDEDEVYGGVREVIVRRGHASLQATGDADHDETYAVIYADAGGTKPLARSNARK